MSNDGLADLQRLFDGWLEKRDRTSLHLLINGAYDYLKGAAHNILRRTIFGTGFPESTTGVLHDGLMRSLNALSKEEFANSRFFEREPQPTVRDFLNFVAYQIRLAVIDVLRKYARRKEQPVAMAFGGGAESDSPAAREEPSQHTNDPARLAQLTEFHQAVKDLPDNLREVFELRFYAEVSEAEVATVLGIAGRTVRLYYAKAKQALASKCPCP